MIPIISLIVHIVGIYSIIFELKMWNKATKMLDWTGGLGFEDSPDACFVIFLRSVQLHIDAKYSHVGCDHGVLRHKFSATYLSPLPRDIVHSVGRHLEL